MDKKVSIIVPVYMCEHFLDKCMLSLINQTYKNIEIILVDDGSKDNCPSICDDYAKIDSRILVIHQKNQGVSAARNAGLNQATGEYLMFVDSDDYIAATAVEDCLSKALSGNYDLVVFDWYCEYKNKIIPKYVKNCDCNNAENFLKAILWDLTPSFPCNKFYKKYLWDKIKFPINTTFEDMSIMPDIASNVKSCCHLKKNLYFYNQTNPNSITSKISSINKYGMFIAWYKRNKIAEKKQLKDLTIYSKKRALKSAITCYGLNTQQNTLSKRHLSEIMDFLIKEKNNPELSFLGVKYRILLWDMFNLRILCKIYGKFMLVLCLIKHHLRYH